MRLSRCVLSAAAAGAVMWPVAPAISQTQAIPAPIATDGKSAAIQDEDSCGRARAARVSWRGGAPPAFTDEGYGDTDVLHYALDIEVFPASSSISGTNVITIRSLIDGLSQFTFRLRSQFTITSALINGSIPVVVNGTSTSTRVAALDRAYNTGETFTLTIAYNGLPATGGFGSFNFSTVGGYPFIDTLSEPYYAHTWWPCKDGDVGLPGDNSDKATFELAITAPDTLSTTSNGVLVGVDTLSGGRKRYRWATGYPMTTYLLAFATGRFNTWAQNYNHGAGTMPVVFNIYPSNDTPANRAAWEQCIPMMEAFRPIFGLYPFIDEKYGLYNFTFGGGMEHQTNTGQSGFGESLTSHELSHQWWGDAITCKTWNHIWLNEGFATYGEALWLERKPGSSGLPALHSAMAARRPSSYNGSVYRYDVSTVGAIFSSNFAYRKGGWVLHQLRHVVGDQDFFDTLLAYRAAYEDSAATTEDFRVVAESVSGTDLDWFFQEWVYGTGAPAYQFGYQPFAVNGQNYARVHIQQTQTASYGIYTMPVDLRINYSGGNQTHTVWNNALTQHYVLPVPAAPTGVALDEFNWILSQSKTSVAYVNGPPKVVQASPSPGATLAPSATHFSAAVTFSEAVAATGSDFELVGPGGPVSLVFAYSPGNYTATLDAPGPLAAGAYTLTVRDSIVSAAASIILDGEVGAALPTGDGLPGGDSVITFTVESPPCYPDCTLDGVLTVADFGCFQTKFVQGDPYTDCNGDGVLTVADFGCFQTRFAAGCP